MTESWNSILAPLFWTKFSSTNKYGRQQIAHTHFKIVLHLIRNGGDQKIRISFNCNSEKWILHKGLCFQLPSKPGNSLSIGTEIINYLLTLISMKCVAFAPYKSEGLIKRGSFWPCNLSAFSGNNPDITRANMRSKLRKYSNWNDYHKLTLFKLVLLVNLVNLSGAPQKLYLSNVKIMERVNMTQNYLSQVLLRPTMPKNFGTQLSCCRTRKTEE